MGRLGRSNYLRRNLSGLGPSRARGYQADAATSEAGEFSTLEETDELPEHQAPEAVSTKPGIEQSSIRFLRRFARSRADQKGSEKPNPPVSYHLHLALPYCFHQPFDHYHLGLLHRSPQRDTKLKSFHVGKPLAQPPKQCAGFPAAPKPDKTNKRPASSSISSAG